MYYIYEARAAAAVKYISISSRRNIMWFSKHCSVTMVDAKIVFPFRKWEEGVNG